MPRRIRSAILPLHRHALPQMAIDGALVAIAYLLAYRLRFDQGVPERYDNLFWATLPWVVPSSLIVFVLFGLYTKRWRYVGQRDYMSILQAVIVATLVVVGFIAVRHPVTSPSPTGFVAVTPPKGVVAMYLLLTLAFVGGVRFAARSIY